MGGTKSSKDVGANSQKSRTKSSLPKGGNSSTADDTETSNSNNKPRNLMVTDATTPLQFAFPGRFGIANVITVHQRPDEDTWPGGAVWDAGWCMSQLLAGMAASAGKVRTTTTTGEKLKRRSSSRTIEVPTRVSEALLHLHLMDCSLVLELGCGAGLTGLVAAAALRAKATVLTDLKVVVDKATQPNVELNTTQTKRNNGTTIRTIEKGQGQVLAMPLCWGNADDEQAVATVLQQLNTAQPKGRPRKKKSDEVSHADHATISRSPGMPDLVLIGDVAYQQYPGAPSHFEELRSTLLKFVDAHTVVLFGTRIRMPASTDLLDMLLLHFDELVQPAVTADEIDFAAFSNVKHNMSIHFLRLKRE